MLWPAHWPDDDLGEYPVRFGERTQGNRWSWRQDQPCVTAVQQIGIMEGRYLRELLAEPVQ